MKSKGLIIVGGYIGVLPSGGITWHYIQYVLGFKQLGYEVVYVEDTRLYPIYQKGKSSWNDVGPVIKNLAKIMERFGLSEQWIYRDEVTAKNYGMDMRKFLIKCTQADVFVNISCSTIMRDEYHQIPTRILIDTDPMFTQMQMATGDSFTEGKSTMNQLISSHSKLFTYAENIDDENCLIPTFGYTFYKTRQPIILDQWPVTTINSKGSFTTLMNYSLGKEFVFEGETWGQKDIEFEKIKDLPKRLPHEQFEISVSKTGALLNENEESIFTSNKWLLKDPEETSKDELIYKGFIQSSMGEVSIAKNTYVKAHTGWFSDRSACYLASGRPVITQDTGWSNYFTTGIGLFAFSTVEEAMEAIENVSGDLANHSKSARLIAEAYFDSDKVLTRLLDQAFSEDE